jgi:hypothetical protein
MVFTKENLVELLRNNVVTVTFTKVDGTERKMTCTLLGDYFPNASNTSMKMLQENAARSDKNISVWDTEMQGWRSFRISSVKSVTIG